MLAEYVPLLWLFGLCGVAIMGILAASSRFGPRPEEFGAALAKGDDDVEPTSRTQPFECGSQPIGAGSGRVSVGFYLAALVFLVFGAGATLMIPWAVAFQALGWYGFWGMVVFVAIFAVGFVYARESGVFEWD